MARKFSWDKKLANFKFYFTKAHKRMRKSRSTADNAGYRAANNAIMKETAIHLENLASNTPADWNIVASISETNTRLVAEIAAVNVTLAVAVVDIAALRVQLSGMGSCGRGRGRGEEGRGSFQHHPGGRGKPHPARSIRKHNNTNYCFSCGYDVHDWHTSESCPWMKVNHAIDATSADNKGGSQKNKALVEWGQESLGINRNKLKVNNNLYPHTDSKIKHVEYYEGRNKNQAKSLVKNNFAITDSGTTDHFLERTSPYKQKYRNTNDGITVMLPDGSIITSSHTGMLDMNHLPEKQEDATCSRNSNIHYYPYHNYVIQGVWHYLMMQESTLSKI